MKFGVSKHVEEPARSVANGFVEAMLIALAAWELLAGRLGAPAFFLFLYVGRVVMGQIGALGAAYTQIQGTLRGGRPRGGAVRGGPGNQGRRRRVGPFADRIALEDGSGSAMATGPSSKT